MRILSSAVLVFIGSAISSDVVSAKQPNRAKGPVAGSRRTPGNKNVEITTPPTSRRRSVIDDENHPKRNRRPARDDDYDQDEEEEDEQLDTPDSDQYDVDADDAVDDDYEVPRPRGTKGTTIKRQNNTPPRREAAFVPKKRPPPTRRYDDEEEEDYADSEIIPPTRSKHPPGRRSGPPPQRRTGPPPNRGRPGGNGGRVVPYNRQAPGGAAATLTKGWEVLKSSLPDPATVKDAALSSITAVQQTTSSLSANLYRELKGITSSELEQVMLKATSPDDTAVKGKHVERLVGVTYQISPRYDIYDAVLRKLWSKMAEKDWRTTMKALYILHRFSADGAPEHAPALKARLRELRRTQDPKRKDKYFNSKQMLAGDNNPKNAKYRAFLSRYSHYVLLRAQSFGGMFDEISTLPKPDKKSKIPPKPITSTSLRIENLDSATKLLTAGLACQLKEGEECENTAIATERVASDLIGLTTAVAVALNRALKGDDLSSLDGPLIKKWCEFYSEILLPQTRAMVKKSAPKLDAYSLFLPSRMGTTVAADLLEKGLQLGEEGTEQSTEEVSAEEPVETSVDTTPAESSRKPAVAISKSSEAEKVEEKSVDEDVAEEEEEGYEDEYEYDEEEEYYEEEE